MTTNPVVAPQVHAQRAPAAFAGHPQVDVEQKKAQDILDALNLINQIKEDVNAVLDNVGKSNSFNNYSNFLLKRNRTSVDDQKSKQQSPPETVKDQTAPTEPQYSLTREQNEFFEKTDNKYLQERILDLNKSLGEFDKLIKELQPVQMINIPDFNSILLDQNDERVNINSTKFIDNFRWCLKVQESVNLTTLYPYKRFSQNYMDRKSLKYPSYSIKSCKKEELEKLATSFLGNEIKVFSVQMSENEFVLDILMPQNFKFVLLLFDSSVEKMQVRPLDSRMLKAYASNKSSNEICHFDFEHKNLSNVFQRLEKNCLFGLLFFKTEQGINHLKHFLSWVKSFVNLFNAKCVKCEKHLLNGVPPTWRDLRTNEAFHDECKF